MGNEQGVWIEDGTIHIDDAEIEANLHELARRRGVPIEEALYRALVNAAS